MKFLATTLLALLTATVSAGAAADDQWVEVNSPHFNVLTDGGERHGREVALQFEQMRSVFGQLFLQHQVSQGTPLRVIALKNERQLSRFAPLYQGKPVSLVGFYLHSQDEDFIVVDLGAPNHWETVFHEYAHLLLNANMPDLPAWFSEGLAEFYSTIVIGEKQAIIGRAPSTASQALSAEGLLPLVNLFAVDHSSPAYNDDHDHRTVFYAESWLVVHYLWDNHRMDQAQDYLELMRRHASIPDAIKQAFHMDPAQFDLALNKYRKTGGETLRVAIPQGVERVSLSAKPAQTLEVAAVLADLHSHQADYLEQSIREFKEILQQDPENAAAHRGLGYALYNQQKTEAAIPHLSKAAEKSPGDWLVHYYWASAMAQKQDDRLAAQIEREARLVTQLNPALADGFGLMGFALMTENRSPEAIAAYERALGLNPASEVYALNLAELYLLQGQKELAKALFSRLQESSNLHIAMVAQRHMEMLAAPEPPANK